MRAVHGGGLNFGVSRPGGGSFDQIGKASALFWTFRAKWGGESGPHWPLRGPSLRHSSRKGLDHLLSWRTSVVSTSIAGAESLCWASILYGPLRPGGRRGAIRTSIARRRPEVVAPELYVAVGGSAPGRLVPIRISSRGSLRSRRLRRLAAHAAGSPGRPVRRPGGADGPGGAATGPAPDPTPPAVPTAAPGREGGRVGLSIYASGGSCGGRGAQQAAGGSAWLAPCPRHRPPPWRPAMVRRRRLPGRRRQSPRRRRRPPPPKTPPAGGVPRPPSLGLVGEACSCVIQVADSAAGEVDGAGSASGLVSVRRL